MVIALVVSSNSKDAKSSITRNFLVDSLNPRLFWQSNNSLKPLKDNHRLGLFV